MSGPDSPNCSKHNKGVVAILFGTHFAHEVWTSTVSGDAGLHDSLEAGIITAWIHQRFTNTILRASST
jgi:ABC-type transport system involved in cytochrome c biogenesis permease subunit